MARFAAALLDEADAFDAHAAFERLRHVVDGQAGHGNGSESLHLDAGFTRHLDGCAYGQTGKLGIWRDVDGDAERSRRDS